MSKLGKKPINIPKDTKIKVENGTLILTGPKGSKELSINDKIFSTTISEDNNLILKMIKKNESSNMIWGTTRSIINNAIIGVSLGHEKILELSGVGFRAILKDNILNLQLGFSHDTSYKIPDGAKITLEKNTIIKINSIAKPLNIFKTRLPIVSIYINIGNIKNCIDESKFLCPIVAAIASNS